MFNQTHIIYMIISAIVTIGIALALFFIKSKKLNKIAIWFFAISTVVIHFSGLWYQYLTEAPPRQDLNIFFPSTPVTYACGFSSYLPP